MLEKIIELLKPVVNLETKLIVISMFIGRMLGSINLRITSLESRQLQKGDKGDKGDPGRDGVGINGKDGKNGKDGIDGKDGQGKDGKDGEDGVSVVDSWIAADGNLILKLSDGREIDVGNLFEVDIIKRINNVFLKQGVNVTIGEKVTNGLPGSVLFIDALNNLAQNNTKLYWDYTNNRLGIGTNTPTALLSLGAGTTTIPQMNFANSVLKTTPIAGDFEYSDGHWFVTNGARHSLSSGNGIKLDTSTVTNTIAETLIYTYTFAPNELHADERIITDISGYVTNASAADDYQIIVRMDGNLLHAINRVGGNVANVGFEFKHSGNIRSAGTSGTFLDHTTFAEQGLVYSYGDGTIHSLDTTISHTYQISVVWVNAKAGNILVCNQGGIVFHH